MAVQAIHKVSGDVTAEGEQKILRWLRAQEAQRRAEGELNRSQCDTTNARNDLASWMVPGDGKPGEKICIWYGDSLIQVEVGEPGQDHTVTVRKRGRALNL